jgi:hypothetical protein
MNRSSRLGAAVLLGLGLAAWSLGAAPKAQLWARWLANDPGSRRQVDHFAWESFLGRYLVPGDAGAGSRVRYGEVTPADRAALQGYLVNMQAAAVSQLDRAEQMAYWINLYNALTVNLVLEHYPVASITEINPEGRLLARGPWDAKRLTVEGEALSLNDIEHRILRPIWKDPRVHYAVNCASIGCPNLQPRAYTAANLETLLEKGAREYVGHPRGMRFEGEKLVVSSIYSWFQQDFGGSSAGVLEHLARNSDAATAARLRAYRRPIRYEYDWSLNR